ncbi:helix-turn-helix domain-containing protein [Streptomyces sp. NPDC001156]
MTAPLQNHQALRRRRIERGLNQVELAAKVGITPSHMSVVERGRRGASPRVLNRLAEALGCEITDLLAVTAEAGAENGEAGTEAGAAR